MARSTIALIHAIATEIWGNIGWVNGASDFLGVNRRRLQRIHAHPGEWAFEPLVDAEVRAKLPTMARTGALDLAAQSDAIAGRIAKLGALCAELQEEALAQD